MPTTSGDEKPQTPNSGVYNAGFGSEVVPNRTIDIHGLASCSGVGEIHLLVGMVVEQVLILWFTCVDFLDGWLHRRSATTCFDNGAPLWILPIS